MYSVKQIARWFIEQVDTGSGEALTPLKLQKLLYYAQAWHLTFHNKPLFDEKIEAWAHGPVAPSIYYELRDLSYHPIDKDRFIDQETTFDDETNELLHDVKEVYGIYDGKYLENLTHQENPWIAARKGVSPEARCNEEITLDSMKIFYRKMQES